MIDIAARFGVSRQLIQGRARREGWSRGGGKEFTALSQAEEADGAARRRIVARLFRALDEKMSQIEQRIARAASGEEPQSASDAEKDARALSSLAGLYAKLVELDEQAKRQSKDKGRSGKEAARDADKLREDLARRLDRLNRGGRT